MSDFSAEERTGPNGPSPYPARSDEGLRPAPNVLLGAFGENAMQFERHFRMDLRATGERANVESELRYRIDELFREFGIALAFPQRDVHLDAAAPIPVRLVGPAEGRS